MKSKSILKNMIKEIKLGKNIFPSFDDILPKDINEKLKRFGVSVQFLFDDGISFSYDSDTIDIKHFPGDLSFFDSKSGSRLLTYVENIDDLEFYSEDEESPLVKVKICDTLFR